MKKLLPIVIVLVIIGGGYYLYSNRSSQDGQGDSTQTATERFQGSIEKAVSRGVPLRCEWESEGVKTTSYIKGENIYSETQSEGRVQYTILKDGCTYSWGEGDSPSVKYCFDEVDYSNFDPTEIEGYEVPEGTEQVKQEEVETPAYDCAPATVSDSMFDPPSDIEFMSF